ncbi:uncharacterized protein Dwil_GK24392 [Drosophila willistoni]|uniref:Uncharacterized protein n=1 Tax=Drosophila willistoni TaxID=7260 RepID=B4N0X3_DROWI|nr:uncharacterized protein LOC6644069 [Drosophila willistoni]XP_046866641.1 uncharacterized protein LOC6644069 [Drosophila willistoni]EDW77736.1 uncharacterized protein Dwil_GK24392 [Drosophila willistoni]
MCPNQFMGKSVFPDCHIHNLAFMYSLLQSLQAEETSSEEVDVQLRDRYEVFRQLMSNYPMPLIPQPEDFFQPNLELDLGLAGLARDQDTENQDSSVSSMHTNMGNDTLSLSSDSFNLSQEPPFPLPPGADFEERLRQFVEEVRQDRSFQDIH